MAPPTSILSRTLQSITETKIRELSKQRLKHSEKKQEILANAEAEADKRDEVMQLLHGIKEFPLSSSSEKSISNITRWIEQSRFDSSIPDDMIKSFREELCGMLEIQTRKLDLADLYSRLFTEWALKSDAEPTETDESYEVLDRQKERLQELCDQFEAVVFEPLETDEVEIDLYLQDLFSEDIGVKALEDLRERVKESGEDVGSSYPFPIITSTYTPGHGFGLILT